MGVRKKTKLQFDNEVKKAPTRKFRNATTRAVHEQMHHRVSSHEDENVGVESAHKTEQGAEKILLTGRKLNRFKAKVSSSNVSVASKLQQKRQIKKGYSLKKAESKQTFSKPLVKNTVANAKKVVQFLISHKKNLIGLFGAGFLIFFLLNTLSSCTQIAMSSISTILSTSYTAEDEALTEASVYYTRLEAELDYSIHTIETTQPGYDEYRYTLDAISHDPHELLAYLTAVFEDFNLSEVKTPLEQLFNAVYNLSITEIIETRYRTETHYSYSSYTDPITGNTYGSWYSYEVEVPYDYHILNVTLTKASLLIIIETLLTPEQLELFEVFMETKGNRQAFSNPLDFDWKSAVSSLYGWRVHPLSENLQMHLGLDLAVPLGSSLHAIHSGTIAQIGYDANGFGNFLVLVDENGFQSIYAHCAQILFPQGTSVEAGQIIATAGSTGASTGSHLHLEIFKDGIRLNPYFYLDQSPASTP